MIPLTAKGSPEKRTGVPTPILGWTAVELDRWKIRRGVHELLSTAQIPSLAPMIPPAGGVRAEAGELVQKPAGAGSVWALRRAGVDLPDFDRGPDGDDEGLFAADGGNGDAGDAGRYRKLQPLHVGRGDSAGAGCAAGV